MKVATLVRRFPDRQDNEAARPVRVLAVVELRSTDGQLIVDIPKDLPASLIADALNQAARDIRTQL